MSIVKEFIGKVRWEQWEGFYITDLNDATKFRLHFDQELTEMVGKIIKVTVTYEEESNCCVNCEQITVMGNKKRNYSCNWL